VYENIVPVFRSWLPSSVTCFGMPRCVCCHCLLADERALVLGAKKLGFVFHTRLPEHVTITVVRTSSAVHCRSADEYA